MAAPTGSGRRPATADTAVRSHETSPGRTVFTESGNRDGWIASDLTVGVRR